MMSLAESIEKGETWLASVGLLAFAKMLGLIVDIELVEGQAERVVRWPDGMMWLLDREVWVGAERHRGLMDLGGGTVGSEGAGVGVGGGLWSWGPVVVCETVIDAELLCLRGHRAVWAGAAGTVRLRRLLPVSRGAWEVARGFDCVDLWRFRGK